jgi:hypothetical protein
MPHGDHPSYFSFFLIDCILNFLALGAEGLGICVSQTIKRGRSFIQAGKHFQGLHSSRALKKGGLKTVAPYFSMKGGFI